METYIEEIIQTIKEYSPKLALALFTLILGWIIIRWILKIQSRLMEKRNIDPSLRPFLKSISGVLIKALLLISVASMLGIEVTSFIAILGALGLAVGLALQGSLANFAGGVLILILKPFKAGDYIVTGSGSGTVEEIQIFYTILVTPDNVSIVIPNAQLSNNSITNYSVHPVRRMDLIFGISYESSIDNAKEILQNIAQNEERIHQEPEPEVLVNELADSSINLRFRFWTNAENYWPLNFEIQERVKKEFDKNGISIPFPQRDIHLYQK